MHERSKTVTQWRPGSGRRRHALLHIVKAPQADLNKQQAREARLEAVDGALAADRGLAGDAEEGHHREAPVLDLPLLHVPYVERVCFRVPRTRGREIV